MSMNEKNLKWVRRLLNDPTRHVVFHNAKFDLKMFLNHGVDIFSARATVHCTLILSKIFHNDLFDYSLRSLAGRFCDREDTSDKDEIKVWLQKNRRAFEKEHGRKPGFDDAPHELVKRRCLWDTESTLQLFLYMYPRVKAASPLLYETERQLMFLVVDMEHTGVQVDITRARELKAKAEAGIKDLQHYLDELCCPFLIHKQKKRRRHGEPYYEEFIEKVRSLNTNATAIQLPIVFEKLGFELKYKTKPKKKKKGRGTTAGGRWAFDEYAMMRYVSPPLTEIMRESQDEGWTWERFRDAILATIKKHNLNRREILPPFILKLNEMRKMISTYYNKIINDAVDVEILPNGREIGILHCTFNQAEAKTGRFSSSGPNLQNMPRILGPRECFIPRRGRNNWHFDYEQVEMKFFVHFSQDRDMAKAIAGDIHAYVAAELYQKRQDELSKEQRKRGKGVNFGIIYGSGPPTMAENLTKRGIVTTVAEAAKLVADYHRRFSSVRRTTGRFKTELVRNKYVENPFGRRYTIPPRYAYRALNYMCQGTSADLIKAAMVKIWLMLRKVGSRAKIIMQVHDELVVEIPKNEQHWLPSRIAALMEDRESYFVPITIDAEVVTRRWSKKRSPAELGYSLN